MNYIKELNAFYNQITFHPLSSSAVALWHTLIHFNNLCGWKQEFSVAATQLQLKAGLKSTSFKRAREELLAGGWIHVKSPGANQAAIYQMVSQQMMAEQNNANTPSCPNQASVTSPTQHHNANKASLQPVDHLKNEEPANPENLNTDNNFNGHKTFDVADHKPNHSTVDSTDHSAGHITDHNMDHTTAPFFKQKNTKQRINKNQQTTADAIRFYQDNFGMATPFIAEEILIWINDIGEPLVLHAMKLSLEQGKTTWRYVKGILKAWTKKGITTLEAAKSEETAYHSQRRQKAQHGYSRQHHADIVPDWFKERKQQEYAGTVHSKPNSNMKDRTEDMKKVEELMAKYA